MYVQDLRTECCHTWQQQALNQTQAFHGSFRFLAYFTTPVYLLQMGDEACQVMIIIKNLQTNFQEGGEGVSWRTVGTTVHTYAKIRLVDRTLLKVTKIFVWPRSMLLKCMWNPSKRFSVDTVYACLYKHTFMARIALTEEDIYYILSCIFNYMFIYIAKDEMVSDSCV